ncbi:MAG: multidrug efflux MFS transporter Lde [Anaerolineales bacterium]
MRNWRVTLAAAWVAQFLCIVGFNAVGPFYPFYIRALGITDVHQVTLWAGILASTGAVSMALMSPIWGVLADRHGRKIMVVRATFGGALVLGAMALVQSVQQLFVLRLLQGMLTGTVSAFMTLIATIAPPGEVGFALGMMQMAVFGGASVGPLVGGLVADNLGYRWVFGVTGVLLFAGGLLAVLLIHEQFVPPQGKQNNGLRAGVHTITHSMPVLGAIVALAGISMSNAVPSPVLPLLVESLQRDPSLVNTATGSVYGANAIGAALAAVLIGRLVDRRGAGVFMLACGVGAVLGNLAQALAPSYGVIAVGAFVLGFSVGGLMVSANATLARKAPKEQQGAIYGMSNSTGSAGSALGPMLGASVATAWGMRAPFATAAALMALVTGWVALTLQPRRTEAAGDAADRR